MRSCDSRCLFSGSKGEVCCIEPLRAPPDIRDHPVTHYSLLAMASLTKVHQQTHRSIYSRPSILCFFTQLCPKFKFFFPSPDSGHWSEALPESLDDISLQ